jgi:hypothetical protein
VPMVTGHAAPLRAPDLRSGIPLPPSVAALTAQAGSAGA